MNDISINELMKLINEEIYKNTIKCNHDFKRAEDGTSDLICKKCGKRAKQAFAKYN